MQNIFNNYDRQNMENKEMIIVLNQDDMDISIWRKEAEKHKNVSVYQISEKYQLGKCLNYGIRKSKLDIIAKFDDDDYYAPKYLQEALDALKHKRASIIGKSTAYLYFEGQKALMLYRDGNEMKYRSKVKGGTLVFKRSVWEKVKFDEKRLYASNIKFLRECKKKGFRIYSVSKYNFVGIRREDVSTHTKKTNTEKYMAKCKLICYTNDFIPLITKK